MDVGDQNGENRHQYFTIVTNTFRLQHPSPISVNNIEPPKSPPMEVLHKVTKNAAMIRKANDHKKNLLTRPVEFVTSFDTNNMPKNIFENSISSIFIFVDFLALFLTHFQGFRSFKLQLFSKIEKPLQWAVSREFCSIPVLKFKQTLVGNIRKIICRVNFQIFHISTKIMLKIHPNVKRAFYQRG